MKAEAADELFAGEEEYARQAAADRQRWWLLTGTRTCAIKTLKVTHRQANQQQPTPPGQSEQKNVSKILASVPVLTQGQVLQKLATAGLIA